MAQQLQPSAQLGIFPQFCAQQQMTLVLKEKDQFGNVVIMCEGKALSWSDKTEFLDMAGNHLFDLKNKHFHIHRTMQAEDPAGNVLLTVKAHFQLIGTKMSATFNNFDGQEVELICEGKFLDRKATITHNDQVIAQVGRDFFNARQIFGDHQTHQVSVAPGVDLAMMAAICICLDEQERQKEKLAEFHN
ncbi:tubby C-terminal-like domain-containing protein [Mycena metata]|uniref:Tubby C-terminal-like domain-containing protein n=1 Tax=Mycena metata TaxID=1033252 RepID=A0AAD7MAX5_9AGAR|nr:tubby C-terminal-like domain-containing protein [Mycena metata]